MSEDALPVHSPFLQHHFTEMEQQAETSKLGMWLFLVTDMLLFGGLFVAYGVLSSKHHEAFRAAHEHLDRVLGALNTSVLLLSSFTMVMAVDSARTDQRRRAVRQSARGSSRSERLGLR